MDPETGSTNTSIEDKTDDFCENPTRDTLAEGLMSLLKPTLDQLDERVKATRLSQVELKQELDFLAEELKKISCEQSCPIDIETYANKLTNIRHKITVVSNILQAAQDRLQRLQTQINKEVTRRKGTTSPPDNSSATTGTSTVSTSTVTGTTTDT